MNEWTNKEIILTCLLTIIIGTLTMKGIKFTYDLGVKHGRSQYHQELLNELDAKAGAPVLLYPPTEPVHQKVEKNVE